MSMISVKGFGGESPMLEPRMLPENHAVTATNCYLGRGVLEALSDGTVIEQPSNFASGQIKTLYKYGAAWYRETAVA